MNGHNTVLVQIDVLDTRYGRNDCRGTHEQKRPRSLRLLAIMKAWEPVRAYSSVRTFMEASGEKGPGRPLWRCVGAVPMTDK